MEISQSSLDSDTNKPISEAPGECAQTPTWSCRRCSALNEDKANVYNCVVCDTFQPRLPPLPLEYRDGDFAEQEEFPSRAPAALLGDYYGLQLSRFAPRDVPDAILGEIVSFLMYSFEVNDRVDLMYHRVWYTGRIVEMKDDCFYVSYDGWNSHWDEWIKIGSPRIETYRCCSVGDTSSGATKHLFWPRQFCPDANLIYEFTNSYRYDQDRVVRILELTRNNRSEAMALLANPALEVVYRARRQS
jgi:hypothetical protein